MIEIIIRNSGECPIYEQIVRQIKAQIIQGTLLPDQALPSILHPSQGLFRVAAEYTADPGGKLKENREPAG